MSLNTASNVCGASASTKLLQTKPYLIQLKDFLKFNEKQNFTSLTEVAESTSFEANSARKGTKGKGGETGSAGCENKHFCLSSVIEKCLHTKFTVDKSRVGKHSYRAVETKRLPAVPSRSEKYIATILFFTESNLWCEKGSPIAATNHKVVLNAIAADLSHTKQCR